MHLDLQNGELLLAADAPVALSGARGIRVACTAGTVWLTIEGERGDIFLSPGESHLIAADGLALVEAARGSGRVRLQRQADGPAGRAAAGCGIVLAFFRSKGCSATMPAA